MTIEQKGTRMETKPKKRMREDHRAAISRAHSTHPLLAAARGRGIGTLGALQEALEICGHPVSRAFLSQVMNGKKRCPAPLAVWLDLLTGWRPNG